MRENKCQERMALLKREPLEAFDVREYVFTQVKEASKRNICIYDNRSSDGWSGFLSREGVKHRLNGHGSWGAFVKGNFLQDFVENNCGIPKPLWVGYFDGDVSPKSKEQFKASFPKATGWITMRGKKVAKVLARE